MKYVQLKSEHLSGLMRRRLVRAATAGLGSLILIGFSSTPAVALVPPPGPKDGSIGVQATLNGPPPKSGATIVSPANGQTTGTAVTKVTGYCPNGLLVKIYDNGIFVGSTMCANGSYSIQVALFNGANVLEAHVFDKLDQEGPVSGKVTVTFNDAQFAAFGSHVTLTSQYARRGANPGQKLTWPLILNGGTGPYALSINWGDGSPNSLQSSQFGGEIDISHTYQSAGTYNIIIQATDKNGSEAFLQVVAVISGQAGTTQAGTSNQAGTGPTKIVTKVLWIPAAIIMLLLPLSFWLGRRYELATLRDRLERDNLA